MPFRFSDTVLGMKPSEIREMNKIATTPGMISLGGGMPGPESFPKKELTDIMVYVMENYGDQAMQYGNTLGISYAIKAISEMLGKTEGFTPDILSEQIINRGCSFKQSSQNTVCIFTKSSIFLKPLAQIFYDIL